MEEEKFLSRWSRLKRAAASEAPAAVQPPAAPGAAAAVELPPVETLDFSSDFSVFLQPEVKESMKCAALKKLFHSGRFNTMDGLDVYIDDYNKFEPIPEEMLRRMEQARGLLFRDEKEAPPPESASTVAEAGPEAVREEPPPEPEPPETATG